MKVSNVNIYALAESVKASKYPMSIDTDRPSQLFIETVKKLV